MLSSYSLLKNHAGILLVGDYTSLTWLHKVMHDGNGRRLSLTRRALFLAWPTMCAKRSSDGQSSSGRSQA